MFDNTQSITLWRHQTDTSIEISQALIRRYRHRRYTQVVDAPVPVNHAHWYFPTEPDAASPLPGDEIHESDGLVWTILEVNLSPYTGMWQAVCETYAYAVPTESIEHIRNDVVIASLAVRVGVMTTVTEPALSHRLTFYVRELLDIEPGDVFRRNDETDWTIVRMERPKYRSRWTSVQSIR